MSVDTSSPKSQRWRAALSALAQRDFFLVWVGSGLEALSIAVFSLALTKLVYDQTASAIGVSWLVFTNWFSMLVISPLGGVLVDRLDRRLLLVGASVVSAVLVALLVWIRFPLAAYVFNFILMSASMLISTAQSAILPDIVDQTQLLDANALRQSLSTLIAVAGPLLGGLLIERASMVVTFMFCAALYVIAALCRFLIRLPRPSVLRETAELRGVYEEFVEGVRYARTNPVVSTLVLIFLMIGAGYGLVVGLDMVFAERVLANAAFPAATVYSYLLSTTSAGIFLGSLLVRYLGRRFAKQHVLMVTLSTLGIESLALAFVHDLPLALAIRFARSIGSGINMSLYPTLLQENTEPEKRGRAISLFLSVASISPSLTIYLGGWLADHTSVQVVYGVAGGCMLLAILIGCLLPGYRAIPAHKGKGYGQGAKDAPV